VKVELTRRYSFAASHRRHSAHFDGAENRRVYGNCSNPYGHGHNYVVEVTVAGPVHAETGMIVDIRELDSYVQRTVIEPFDHTYLNKDVEALRTCVPTAENLCTEIFHRVKQFGGARLVRIGLQETSHNSFEYRGEPDGSRT